jgi:hypothetical protein
MIINCHLQADPKKVLHRLGQIRSGIERCKNHYDQFLGARKGSKKKGKQPKQIDYSKIPVLICGDLNSQSDQCIYR